jgi:hypothetical protein
LCLPQRHMIVIQRSSSACTRSVPAQTKPSEAEVGPHTVALPARTCESTSFSGSFPLNNIVGIWVWM